MDEIKTKKYLQMAGGTFLYISALAMAIGIILAITAFTGNRDRNYSETITVQGSAEVFAVPDIAEFVFNVTAEKNTVGEAQKEVTDKVTKVLERLGDLDIEEEDIKTINYDSYPRYEYQLTDRCVPSVDGDCDRERVLVGYELSHQVRVKLRDLDKSGDVLQTLGDAGVSNISGPNLQIDDPDALEAEAKKEAIADAKVKAKQLAEELDVRLGKVISFSDSDGGFVPYLAETRAMNASFDMAEESGFAAPKIPSGQNEIIANVTITYRIK